MQSLNGQWDVISLLLSCPDAPPPIWEQLDHGLVAVKTVVHGLVDFIQNHSKKGNDQQQVRHRQMCATKNGLTDRLRWNLIFHAIIYHGIRYSDSLTVGIPDSLILSVS